MFSSLRKGARSDVDHDGLLTIDRDGFVVLGPVAVGFEVKAHGAEQVLGILSAGALAAAHRDGGQRDQQIELEAIAAESS